MTSNYIYYVYAYIRAKNTSTGKAGTPYYIGKGKDDRAYKKHSVSVPKDKSKIVILEKCLSEVGALALERRLIKWWGRIDNKTGVLHNKTNGGDGHSGFIQSPETIARRVEKIKGHKGRTGQVQTIEERQKRSATMKGRTHTPEHNAKMAAAKTGVTPKEHTCPHCGKVGNGSVMYSHHFDNCPLIGGTKKKVAMNDIILVCPHCNKSGTIGGMKRWHFDNCKTLLQQVQSNSVGMVII